MKSKKKICIVASSLGKGGAERSSAMLSKMLFDLGYDIFIVTILDRITFEYEGTLLNLGQLKNKDNSIMGRLKRLKVFKAFLKNNNIDVIIDNRSRVQAYREFIITKFIYTIPTVYVIHNYNTSKAFTHYKWLNKYLYKHKYMTAVSKSAKDKFEASYGLKNIRTIYNGFDFDFIHKKSKESIHAIKGDYIIFFGRIDDKHKNLKLLLKSYHESSLINNNIKLVILGDGPDLNMLKAYASNLGIGDMIIFKGFVDNPYPYVSRSIFMVLTSRYEGFPMVIPEALSLNIPVISVDCESGPKEVIKNGYNGLIVENFNPQQLSEAMNSFINNSELYLYCIQNASQSVQQFSASVVKKEWDKLLNTI